MADWDKTSPPIFLRNIFPRDDLKLSHNPSKIREE
jgi:hypothetical protein